MSCCAPHSVCSHRVVHTASCAVADVWCCANLSATASVTTRLAFGDLAHVCNCAHVHNCKCAVATSRCCACTLAALRTSGGLRLQTAQPSCNCAAVLMPRCAQRRVCICRRMALRPLNPRNVAHLRNHRPFLPRPRACVLLSHCAQRHVCSCRVMHACMFSGFNRRRPPAVERLGRSRSDACKSARVNVTQNRKHHGL